MMAVISGSGKKEYSDTHEKLKELEYFETLLKIFGNDLQVLLYEAEKGGINEVVKVAQYLRKIRKQQNEYFRTS